MGLRTEQRGLCLGDVGQGTEVSNMAAAITCEEVIRVRKRPVGIQEPRRW